MIDGVIVYNQWLFVVASHKILYFVKFCHIITLYSHNVLKFKIVLTI